MAWGEAWQCRLLRGSFPNNQEDEEGFLPIRVNLGFPTRWPLQKTHIPAHPKQNSGSPSPVAAAAAFNCDVGESEEASEPPKP